MANKIEAKSTKHLQLAAEVNPGGSAWTLEDEVGDIAEMVDYFRQRAFRGENLIRSEVVDGALQMIYGRLKMAVGDL